MKDPLISIIIPSLNQGNFIEQNITSFIKQSYPHKELIIIDGGSTDETLDIIHKYKKHISYIISEKDSGQSNAINKGLKVAKGDIVNWINADDYLAPNSLQTIAELFKNKNTNVVCGYCTIFDNTTNRIIQHYKMRIGKTAEETIFNPYMNQPSTFFKTNIIKQLGYVNESLHYVMDLELWFKYLLYFNLEGITTTNVTLSFFRQHPQSKSSSYQQLFNLEKQVIYFQIYNQLNFPDFMSEFFIPQKDFSHIKMKPYNINSKFNSNYLISLFCLKYAPVFYARYDYNNLKKCLYLYEKYNSIFNKQYISLKLRSITNKKLLNLMRNIKNYV